MRYYEIGGYQIFERNKQVFIIPKNKFPLPLRIKWEVGWQAEYKNEYILIKVKK